MDLIGHNYFHLNISRVIIEITHIPRLREEEMVVLDSFIQQEEERINPRRSKVTLDSPRHNIPHDGEKSGNTTGISAKIWVAIY